jgi:ferrous-iron efflux pump FieF
VYCWCALVSPATFRHLLVNQLKANLATQQQLVKSASTAAVFVAVVLLLAKLWAWMLSDSVGVLTTLFDSVLDASLSIVNAIAVRFALRPPDEDHRFGHGKMEGLAALTQAAFTAGSCLFLVIESSRRLLYPEPISGVSSSLIVMSFSTVLTLALVAYQRHVIRQTNSTLIRADAAHYQTDVFIHIGVMAGLFLGGTAQWWWADAAVAIVLSLLMLRSSYGVVIHALSMLLDRELSQHDRDRIINLVKAHPAVINLHDLRTHASGLKQFIYFDIEVCRDLSLVEAHDIYHEIEIELIEHFPNAEIMIHIDPEGCPADSRHTVRGLHY